MEISLVRKILATEQQSLFRDQAESYLSVSHERLQQI